MQVKQLFHVCDLRYFIIRVCYMHFSPILLSDEGYILSLPHVPLIFVHSGGGGHAVENHVAQNCQVKHIRPGVIGVLTMIELCIQEKQEFNKRGRDEEGDEFSSSSEHCFLPSLYKKLK